MCKDEYRTDRGHLLGCIIIVCSDFWRQLFPIDKHILQWNQSVFMEVTATEYKVHALARPLLLKKNWNGSP